MSIIFLDIYFCVYLSIYVCKWSTERILEKRNANAAGLLFTTTLFCDMPRLTPFVIQELFFAPLLNTFNGTVSLYVVHLQMQCNDIPAVLMIWSFDLKDASVSLSVYVGVFCHVWFCLPTTICEESRFTKDKQHNNDRMWSQCSSSSASCCGCPTMIINSLSPIVSWYTRVCNNIILLFLFSCDICV